MIKQANTAKICYLLNYLIKDDNMQINNTIKEEINLETTLQICNAVSYTHLTLPTTPYV